MVSSALMLASQWIKFAHTVQCHRPKWLIVFATGQPPLSASVKFSIGAGAVRAHAQMFCRTR